MPPPSVRPATPVEPTTPPGVTRPAPWVAVSKSSQVAPPPARATLVAGSTSTRRSRVRSITSPPSFMQCPAGLWPPPRTATSRSCVRAKSSAVATSSAPRQRAITAGRRSMRALKQRRASSYPSSPSTRASPANELRSSLRLSSMPRASPLIPPLCAAMEILYCTGLRGSGKVIGPGAQRRKALPRLESRDRASAAAVGLRPTSDRLACGDGPLLDVPGRALVRRVDDGSGHLLVVDQEARPDEHRDGRHVVDHECLRLVQQVRPLLRIRRELRLLQHRGDLLVAVVHVVLVSAAAVVAEARRRARRAALPGEHEDVPVAGREDLSEDRP